MSTIISLLGSLAASALAQSPTIDLARSSIDAARLAAAHESAGAGLHFSFTPGVWLARLGGTSKLGPSSAADDLDLENDFDLDQREASPNFELAITKGERWQIDVSGFDFSTDASTTFGADVEPGVFGDVAFGPGDAYDASLDITSLALSVSYWQWHLIDSVERGGSLDLRLAWGAGARWLSVEQSFSLAGTGASANGDGEWLVAELILQVDIEYDLPDSFRVLDRFHVLAMGSIGPAIGADFGAVVALRAGMRFWFCDHFSLDFGYRLMEASVQSDEYELAGGLQGLFLSGTLRF